jgi:hypothetical protein
LFHNTHFVLLLLVWCPYIFKFTKNKLFAYGLTPLFHNTYSFCCFLFDVHILLSSSQSFCGTKLLQKLWLNESFYSILIHMPFFFLLLVLFMFVMTHFMIECCSAF